MQLNHHDPTPVAGMAARRLRPLIGSESSYIKLY